MTPYIKNESNITYTSLSKHNDNNNNNMVIPMYTIYKARSRLQAKREHGRH